MKGGSIIALTKVIRGLTSLTEVERLPSAATVKLALLTSTILQLAGHLTDLTLSTGSPDAEEDSGLAQASAS